MGSFLTESGVVSYRTEYIVYSLVFFGILTFFRIHEEYMMEYLKCRTPDRAVQVVGPAREARRHRGGGLAQSLSASVSQLELCAVCVWCVVRRRL